jgi:site-specific DNA-methyltransferase (adenine-specific)
MFASLCNYKDNELKNMIKELESISKIDKIDKILENIRKYIGIGEVEKKTFGEVFTKFELINEMLDTLPAEVWSNPDLKWLDPANGIGNFPVVVMQRLMIGLKNWQPDEELRYKHILENMIYVCDIQPKNMFLWMVSVDSKNEYKLNLYRGSFLDKEFDEHMKNVWKIDGVDIIIGNPPYQNSTSKTHKLWVDFLQKSKNITNYILFITPTLITSGRSDRITKLRKSLLLNLKYINFTKKNIFDIGEKVCYYLIDFTKIYEKTEVILDNYLRIFENFDNIIYENIQDKIKYSIINKIENSNYEKIKWYSDVKNTDGQGAPNTLMKKGIINEKKDEIYIYDFLHSPSQKYFSKNKMSHGTLKIAFNFSGGYYDIKNPERYMIITDSIIGKQLESIQIKDMTEGLNIRNLYSKKIFIYYILNEKTGGFNTGIFKLPKLNFTKSWTDQELYEYFNLTQEEIDLIEKTIK